MALNIKSDEAHRLARELAEATGTSMTDVVTQALRHLLDREGAVTDPGLLLAEIDDIQSFVAGLPDRDDRCAEEILGYDERGLPS